MRSGLNCLPEGALKWRASYTVGGGIGQSRICMFFLRKPISEKCRHPYGPTEYGWKRRSIKYICCNSRARGELMADQYDVIIIGAGGRLYGGSESGRLRNECGLNRKGRAGRGACVNTGCVPAKAMLQASAVYGDLKHASRFGISVDSCWI